MRILEEQIKNDALSNTYIFESANEEANLEFAKSFSKEVFESKGVAIDNEINPDFYLIDKGKDIIDIDTIRSVLKDIALNPQNKHIKIYVIHNAQNMRAEGSNAILKTIEELKTYNMVIFTTTNRDMLLPTIRSRCQIISLDSNKSQINIDLVVLSEILAEISRGDMAYFYKHKDFFNQYKEDKLTLLDGFEEVMKEVINLKYNLNTKLSEDIIYNLRPLSNMKTDSIDKILDLLHTIRINFRNNINYDLAVEEIIFNFYTEAGN